MPIKRNIISIFAPYVAQLHYPPMSAESNINIAL